MAASCSGNSSGSTLLQNSGSEEELQVLMDERKRKRKQSNRESARRSRMRKQKHMDDLMSQLDQLKKDNDQILTNINVTAHNYLNVEAENSILRAQIMELSQRLDYLNEILNFICTSNYGISETDCAADNTSMNPLHMIHLNQPIMASPNFFQY